MTDSAFISPIVVIRRRVPFRHTWAPAASEPADEFRE
jgi:hypothetical protein